MFTNQRVLTRDIGILGKSKESLIGRGILLNPHPKPGMKSYNRSVLLVDISSG